MPEALELQGVSAGIEEEHRGLLPWLTGVPDPRLQDERQAGRMDALLQRAELLPFEQGAEVRHRNLDAFNLSGVLGGRHRAGRVGRDLVAEEVEVDPAVGTAALAAAQDLAVESSGAREVADEKGEVEGLGHGRLKGRWRGGFGLNYS